MRRAKQQLLDLGRYSLDRNRGGRPPGPNPPVPHLAREDFPAAFPCHVTLKARRGLPSLRRPAIVREIEASFRVAKERGDFRLVAYSIQRDHVHLIVEAEGPEALGRGMKSLAARFARAVNRVLRRAGKVLADRYHLTVLTCPRQVRNAIAYVLLNARRHAAKWIAHLRKLGRQVAGLPNAGTIDGASSARWFSGWRPGISIDRTPPAPLGVEPAVAEPRTWLLRKGWREHGLLDPNEIPGALGA